MPTHALSTLPLAASLAAALCSTPVRAESYDNCSGFIDSIPATITSQGNWCLRKNLASGLASGAMISIQANNVSLDCKGFRMGGLAAGPGTLAVGIGSNGRSNVAVRNCGVRGFAEGISLNSNGGIVEDNVLTDNTYSGIAVAGTGNVVRRNRVLNTGGTTSVTLDTILGYGIFSLGDADTVDNTVSGVFATPGSNGFAIGINVVNNPLGNVERNRISGILADGTGYADGISVAGTGTGRVVLNGNHILGEGLPNSIGLLCFNAAGNQVYTYDNLISGFQFPLSPDCAVDGGNRIVEPTPP